MSPFERCFRSLPPRPSAVPRSSLASRQPVLVRSPCPSVRPSVRSPSLVLLDDPIGTLNTEYICICTYWRFGQSQIVSAVSLCTWMTCTYTSTMMMCPCREWGECAALGGDDRSKDYTYSDCKYIELLLHCSSTSWLGLSRCQSRCVMDREGPYLPMIRNRLLPTDRRQPTYLPTPLLTDRPCQGKQRKLHGWMVRRERSRESRLRKGNK